MLCVGGDIPLIIHTPWGCPVWLAYRSVIPNPAQKNPRSNSTVGKEHKLDTCLKPFMIITKEWLVHKINLMWSAWRYSWVITQLSPSAEKVNPMHSCMLFKPLYYYEPLIRLLRMWVMYEYNYKVRVQLGHSNLWGWMTSLIWLVL